MEPTVGNRSTVPPTSAKADGGWSVGGTPHSSLGYVVAVNISGEKGARKKNISQCQILTDYGLEGDSHAGSKRQVSLLALESIRKMRKIGLRISPGDFAENITTQGFDLTSLPIGTKLKIGEEVLLEVTQVGKVCHNRCAIYYQAGDCVMPKEGIFCQVLKGGPIKTGNRIEVER